MGIDALFTPWLDRLASLVASLREAWRMRGSLVVAETEAGFVLRGADGAPPRPLRPDVIRTARRHFVILEVPADEIVEQHIELPAQAGEFAADVVRNQIERLSPWQVEHVAYGFMAEPKRAEPGQLDIRVCMAARDSVDAIRARLADAGLAADKIVAPTGGDAPAVALWSRLGDGAGRDRRVLRLRLATAFCAILAASIGATVWAMISAASIRADRDDLGARAEAVEHRLQGTRGAPDAMRDPAQRAWALKRSTPAAVLIVERLSKALPDNAYVTDLSLVRGTLRLSGVGLDAPSLLAPLEQADLMSAVHFYAPTTRSPDGAAYLFHIEGQLAGGPTHEEN